MGRAAAVSAAQNGGANPSAAQRKPVSRDVWFSSDRPVMSTVLHRDSLAPGNEVEGPAIIEQFDSTTVIGPTDRLRVDDAHNLIIEVGR